MAFDATFAAPSVDVVSGGTITLDYPNGRTADDYAASGHTAYVYNAARTITPSFGGSDISFTWTGPTIPAGTRVPIELALAEASVGGGASTWAELGSKPANLVTLAALASVANLSTLAALASVANLSAVAALTDVSNLETLADLASVSNLSTVAGLASVANVSALAGLTGAANKVPYFTGAGTMAVADFTTTGRSLVAAADAAAVRALITPTTTNGDLLVHAGGVLTRLAGGTDGYVLKMVSGAPAWAASTGGSLPAEGSEGDVLTVVSGSWASAAPIDIGNIPITWNNGATSFTAFGLYITDTASLATSKLIDAQVGGTSQFSVSKTGLVTHNGLVAGTVGYGYIGYYGIKTWNGAYIGFASGGSGVNASSAGPDTAFYRDGAGVMAQRNGANAQSARIYYTYTNTSNYQRLALNTAAAAIELAAETLGTGAADIDLKLTPAGTGVVQFGTHSAITAETVTGYVTIKDAGGTSRKVAVVS